MTIDSVKIRMYRHGFGDCFLLRYFAGETCTFSMLIDCGLKLNDSEENASLKQVVDDIADTVRKDTGLQKPKLDLLVVTHEHWDHVSGFHPDKKYFDDFVIDKIWMAWTESPTDRDAVRMREHIYRNTNALHVASELLKKETADDRKSTKPPRTEQEARLAMDHFSEAVTDVASFFGPVSVSTTHSQENGADIRLKKQYTVSVNSLKAMDHVKGFTLKHSGIDYLYPGDLREGLPSLPGMRFYVLGPPKSALLNKENPSSGAKKEVYLGLKDTSLSGFVDGLLQLTQTGSPHDGSPFNHVVTIDPLIAANDPRFASYFEKDSDYRIIDNEWLHISGTLAMQLDQDTNNTSLALAIEFTDSGKTLLFPADAQVGSWLSWHDLIWETERNGKKEPTDMKSLFKRTVFYKVGHHASHNATLKAGGLELMTSPELVAFIPEKQQQYPGIPYAPLVDRIRAKSKGRTFFSADANEPPEKVLDSKPAELSATEWAAFKKRCRVEPLYVEYTVEG